MIELGTFECQSGMLIPADPCYVDKEGRVFVKKGKWKAYIVEQEGRNTEILVLHESCNLPDILKMEWVEGPDVPVDSGQAGFFDYTGEYDTFYGECCSLCETELGAGVLDYGAVMCSGWGDGWYGCWMGSLDKKETVAGRIHFFQDESIFLDLVKIQETKQKDLPLLVEQMKTPVGKKALEEKLK